MPKQIINQVPYLRSSRAFPPEVESLAIEVNRSYVDIASAVNNRTIGLFPTNRPAIGGESWFIDRNQRQQNLRQVYTFTSTASITHGLDFTEINHFVRSFGNYTDGTNWYGLIAGSNTAIAGQISFYITPTQIVFATGGGAPTLTSGILVLEWISDA